MPSDKSKSGWPKLIPGVILLTLIAILVTKYASFADTSADKLTGFDGRFFATSEPSLFMTSIGMEPLMIVIILILVITPLFFLFGSRSIEEGISKKLYVTHGFLLLTILMVGYFSYANNEETKKRYEAGLFFEQVNSTLSEIDARKNDLAIEEFSKTSTGLKKFEEIKWLLNGLQFKAARRGDRADAITAERISKIYALTYRYTRNLDLLNAELGRLSRLSTQAGVNTDSIFSSAKALQSAKSTNKEFDFISFYFALAKVENEKSGYFIDRDKTRIEKIDRELSQIETKLTNLVSSGNVQYASLLKELAGYEETFKKLFSARSLIDQIDKDLDSTLAIAMRVAKEGADTQIREAVALSKSASQFSLIFIFTAFLFSMVTYLAVRSILSPIKKITSIVHNIDHDAQRQPLFEHDEELSTLVEAVYDYKDSLYTEIVVPLERLSEGKFDFVPSARGEKHSVRNSVERAIEKIAGAFISTSEAAGRVAKPAGLIHEKTETAGQSVRSGVSDLKRAIKTLKHLTLEVSNLFAHSRNLLENAGESRRRISSGTGEIDRLCKELAGITGTGSNIADVVNNLEDMSREANLLAMSVSIKSARAKNGSDEFGKVAEEMIRFANSASKTSTASAKRLDRLSYELRKYEKGVERVSLVNDKTNKEGYKLYQSLKMISAGINKQRIRSRKILALFENLAKEWKKKESLFEGNRGLLTEMKSSMDDLESLLGSFGLDIGHEELLLTSGTKPQVDDPDTDVEDLFGYVEEDDEPLNVESVISFDRPGEPGRTEKHEQTTNKPITLAEKRKKRMDGVAVPIGTTDVGDGDTIDMIKAKEPPHSA